MRLLVVLALAVGCIRTNSVLCENGRTCGPDKACDVTHDICVDPDQLTACDGLEEADDCRFGQTDGKCEQGVCLVPLCGNNIIDVGEICDVGDTQSLDGCAADCKSDETCGNRVVDLLVPEACDDGNNAQHDGCTSTCGAETARWIDLSAGGPSPRSHAAFAYDVNRGALVLFGGVLNSGEAFSDTWEWRGSWTQPPPLVAPNPVELSGAAYHHKLGRMIVHGGSADAGLTGAVLTWDGAKWARLSGADGPAVARHAIAYDARRERVVVFGGANAVGDVSDETWEFDGTTWRKITTATTPVARIGAVATYDPVNNVVLMYGGNRAPGGASGELWAYDGVTWTLRNDSTSNPPILTGPSFAYHVPSGAAILFGGETSGGMSAGTWSTPGTPGAGWTLRTTVNTPTARRGASMAADGHGRLIMFGGFNGSTEVGDTWIFDGTNWTQGALADSHNAAGATHDVDRRRMVVYGGQNYAGTWERSELGWQKFTGTAPPFSIVNMGLVYDEKNRQTVAFGGFTGTPTGQTWLWNGATWAMQTPAMSPPVTHSGRLVYDLENQRVLLFGPTPITSDNPPPQLDDTTTALWSWTGGTWTALQPVHVPTRRLGSLVGYDRIRHQIVLYGGTDGNASIPFGFTDTWVFEDGDWREVTPAAAVERPPAISSKSMVWNPARGRLTMLDANMSAWEWFGTHWQQVPTASRPPPRQGFNLVPSLDGTGLSLIFGGDYGLVEEWQLRWDGTGASESCERPSDVDGDKLVGCADPDCWQVCTPQCSPGVSCAPDASTCGDLVCDPAEDCYSCAADCPCAVSCGDFVCQAGETMCPGDCP